MNKYIASITQADGTEIKALITTNKTPFQAADAFRLGLGDSIIIVDAEEEMVEKFKDKL